MAESSKEGKGSNATTARASANGSTVFPKAIHTMFEAARARARNNPSVYSMPDAK
jgi:hypothetical protein